MGLILPSARQTIWQSNFPATPSTAGTVVTASSTIHTKGSYAELIAATTYDSYGFWLFMQASQSSAAATSQLLDIAIGAAASEVVILPDVQSGWRSTIASTRPCFPMFVPMFVPKGSRIAARLQALISSDTVQVTIVLNGGSAGPQPIPTFVGCDVYGLDAANSRGTLHTAGDSGAESADANIGTTTSRSYKAVGLDVGLGALTVVTSNPYHVELTDGTNTFCEWLVWVTANEDIGVIFPNTPFLHDIPAATQLMLQAEYSGVGAQELDFAFRCYY